MTSGSSGCAGGRVERYPRELEGDFETRGGATLRLRPIRPDDGERLAEFHDQLSPESVYRRFFFVHPRLSAAEVERFTHVDYVNRLALVVECAGDLVAVGRYERLQGTQEAEVAFVVADRFQHQGIGTTLLEHLAEAALHNGIHTFCARTLAENRDMLDVFMNSGFQVTSTSEYGTIGVRFPIDPDDAYRSAYNRRHHPEEHRHAEPGGESWP